MCIFLQLIIMIDIFSFYKKSPSEQNLWNVNIGSEINQFLWR